MRKRWNKTRNSFCCASHSRSSVTAGQIVAVGTVPQSVPLGTPRKPLQGLAVPQFHDFRRIGEKRLKKHRGENLRGIFRPRPVSGPIPSVSVPFHSPFHWVHPANPYRDWMFHSSMISGGWVRKNRKTILAHPVGKGLPHVRPTSPVCASTRAGGLTDPQSGENPPRKPASRLVCGRERRERGRERERGAEGGKTPVFLPDSGGISPDLFQSRNKRCSHISPQQRTEEAKNRFFARVWRLMKIGSFGRGAGSVCRHAVFRRNGGFNGAQKTGLHILSHAGDE